MNILLSFSNPQIDKLVSVAISICCSKAYKSIWYHRRPILFQKNMSLGCTLQYNRQIVDCGWPTNHSPCSKSLLDLLHTYKQSHRCQSLQVRRKARSLLLLHLVTSRFIHCCSNKFSTFLWNSRLLHNIFPISYFITYSIYFSHSQGSIFVNINVEFIYQLILFSFFSIFNAFTF